MLFETVQSSSRPFFQAWYISRNTVSAAMPIESRRLPPMEVWGKNGDLSGRNRLPIQRVKFGGSWTYYCDTQV